MRRAAFERSDGFAGYVWLGRPAWTGVINPFRVLWLTWLNLRSVFIGARAGGIRWRNTFYPSALPRGGIRVTWP